MEQISVGSETPQKKTGQGRGPGGCIGLVLAVLGIGILPIIVCGGGVLAFTTVFLAETWFVPGDAARFDPVASYAAVQQWAGRDLKLVSMEAQFVRPDGTLELSAGYNPSPEVRYTFVRELSTPPGDAPPLGAGNTIEGRWYETVNVVLRKPFQMRRRTSGSSRFDYLFLGMQRDTSSPAARPPGEAVPEPGCSLKDLWSAAREKGAPGNAVAVIRYDAFGYVFRVEGTGTNIAFGPDCRAK